MSGPPSTSAILDAAGTTFAVQSGLRLRNTPAPLFQLLVLSALLAKPIGADLAVAGARELRAIGVRTPQGTSRTTWQQRVDALGRAHYRRFDESMATRVSELADFVAERYRGDLRRLAEPEDVGEVQRRLTEAPGIGPAGADIFLREAQAVWTWAAPYLDQRVVAGAARLGLSRDGLRRRFARVDAAALCAALVRVDLDDGLAERLLGSG